MQNPFILDLCPYNVDLKRVLLILVSNVFFLFFTFSSHTYAQTADDWTIYNNPTHGVEILHPNDWQVDIEQVADIPGDYITTIALLYPASEALTDAEDSEEFLSIYLEIGIDELVKPISVQQYLDDVINSYNSDESLYEDVSIVQRDATRTMLAGKQAYSLIFTAESEGDSYKVLETGAIHNGKPYFLRYDAEEGLYEKYLPTAQKMIDSFKFTK
jgi:eukaryotic-like serine/threonine-protein kinase